LAEDKDKKSKLLRELNNLKAKVEKIEGEVGLRDKSEFEENRRCLLNIAHSKNQTHAGYLIAIVIGALTLISRWDIFFNLPQKPVSPSITIIFFIMISAIIAITIYLVERTFYWTSYGTAVLNLPTSEVETLFKRYISDKEHKDSQELVPYGCKLNDAVAQHLKELKPKEKNWLTKFALMDDKDLIKLSVVSGLISFLILLNIWLLHILI
jgi:hypothetical protein